MPANECAPETAIPGYQAVAAMPLRYFNQPIEQIPGYNKKYCQVLCHSSEEGGGDEIGLYWANVKCVEVVKCIQIIGSELVAKFKTIPVFEEFDSTNYCSVPLTYCDPAADVPPGYDPDYPNPDDGYYQPPTSPDLPPPEGMSSSSEAFLNGALEHFKPKEYVPLYPYYPEYPIK